MTKTVATLILCLLTTIMFGQSFEGKITYDNSYKSKNPNMTDKQWTDMMGAKQEYIIKNGDYKSTTNGTFLMWQLYINNENKLYMKMSNSEAILWNDASVQNDQVLKTELNKNVTEILGYKCDELILTCKSGIQKYYFNSAINVDSKIFAQHKFGNWYDYLAISNALPLKYVIETAQFSLTSTVTKVEAGKIDSKELQLPLGSKTEKSPY